MHVLGDYNSPVIPAVIYVPAKLSAFSKECYDRGLAVSTHAAIRSAQRQALEFREHETDCKASWKGWRCSRCWWIFRAVAVDDGAIGICGGRFLNEMLRCAIRV